jgi:hypothetical protein
MVRQCGVSCNGNNRKWLKMALAGVEAGQVGGVELSQRNIENARK